MPYIALGSKAEVRRCCFQGERPRTSRWRVVGVAARRYPWGQAIWNDGLPKSAGKQRAKTLLQRAMLFHNSSRSADAESADRQLAADPAVAERVVALLEKLAQGDAAPKY